MIEDVRKLLKYQRSMLPAASTSPNDSSGEPARGYPGDRDGRWCRLSVFSAVSTAHASGMSQMIAATSSTPKASQFMILRGSGPAAGGGLLDLSWRPCGRDGHQASLLRRLTITNCVTADHQHDHEEHVRDGRGEPDAVCR